MKRSVLVMLLAIAVAHPVTAQTPTRDTTVFRLPAITVSGTRTPLRVIDVPLAVTVVGQDEFQNTNGHRIDEALRMVPGVLAQSRYGGSDVRIVVRGFGARGAGDRSNAGTTRGVRILQDGFPETEPDGRTALDLIDLAAITRVEVVRSNASALWGNAGGALINFSSLPPFNNSNVSTGFAVGGFGLQRHIVQGGADLGNGTLYATFGRTMLDGWRANSEADRKFANVGLSTTIGDHTQLRAHAVAADNAFNIPGPLTLAQLNADPEQANATYLARLERRRNRIGRLGVEIAHDLTSKNAISGMLFVNPKFLQRSERGTFRDFTRYHIGGNLMFRDQRQFSSAVRGAFTAGIDEAYQDGAILFYGLTTTGERAGDLRDNKREGANNFGVFAQEALSISEKVDLTLGGRWDNITYYAQSFINPRLDDQKSFKKLSPKVGVLYRFTPSHTIYGNVGSGVEVPAGNETDPVGTFGTDTITALNPLLKPIRSTTFELGTKQIHEMQGGFLRAFEYDLALYRTNVRNEIVPYRGGRFYFTAARAERMGAELGLRASTAPGLALSTALTFSDNRYRDYVVDSVHYSRPGFSADYSDNKIVGVPDRMIGGALRYTPTFFSSIGLDFEVQHVGSFFADDANRTVVPGYTLLHAGFSLNQLRIPGTPIAVRGFVRAENLSDKQYVASAFLNPDIVGGVPVAFEPGLPRHAVVSLSVGWARP